MKRLMLLLLFILGMAALVSFKTKGTNEEGAVHAPIANPKTNNTPKPKPDLEIPMGISWYGPRFHGRKTASGEQFNMFALTAAHRYFPFGTMIEISNPQTGKDIMVRVNDRGPYIDPKLRHLDISYGAALALGIVEEGIRVKRKSLKAKIWFPPSSSSKNNL